MPKINPIAPSGAGTSTSGYSSGPVKAWTDPHFGYTPTTSDKGKPTGKFTYSNPYGLGQLGTQHIGGVWEILGFDGQDYQFGNGPGSYAPANITADQAAYLFDHASPEQLAAIQQRLYLAGLYDSGKLPQFGVLTQADRNAFKTALFGVAAQGDQASLKDYLDTIATGGSTAKQRAPLVIKLSKPEDIKTIIQATAKQVYGRNLDSGELESLVQTYQQLQAQTQQENYNAGDSSLTGVLQGGPGGTVTQMAGGAGDTGAIQMFADQRIRDAHPNEVAAESFGNMFQTLLDSFTKPTV